MLAGIEDPACRAARRGGGQAHATSSPARAPRSARMRAAIRRRAAEARSEWQRAYRRGVLDAVLQGKGHQSRERRTVLGARRRYRLSQPLEHGGLRATGAASDKPRSTPPWTKPSPPSRARAPSSSTSATTSADTTASPSISPAASPMREGSPTPKSRFGAQGRRAAAVLCRAVEAGALSRPGLSAHQRRDGQRRGDPCLVHAGAAECGPCRRHHPRRLLRHDREAAAERLDADLVGRGLSRPAGPIYEVRGCPRR